MGTINMMNLKIAKDQFFREAMWQLSLDILM